MGSATRVDTDYRTKVIWEYTWRERGYPGEEGPTHTVRIVGGYVDEGKVARLFFEALGTDAMGELCWYPVEDPFEVCAPAMAELLSKAGLLEPKDINVI